MAELEGGGCHQADALTRKSEAPWLRSDSSYNIWMYRASTLRLPICFYCDSHSLVWLATPSIALSTLLHLIKWYILCSMLSHYTRKTLLSKVWDMEEHLSHSSLDDVGQYSIPLHVCLRSPIMSNFPRSLSIQVSDEYKYCPLNLKVSLSNPTSPTITNHLHLSVFDQTANVASSSR